MKGQTLLGRTYIMQAGGDCVAAMGDGNYSCAVEADIERIEKSEYLVLYIYRAKDLLAGDTKAVTRTFIDKYNYITQDTRSQEPKWLTATMKNLLHTFAPYGKEMYHSDDTKRTIADYFGVQYQEDFPLRPVFEFQEKYLAMKMSKKDNAIKEAADKDMGIVPEIPKDFAQWVEESALLKSRYIFYKYTGKVNVQGYCTHCKQDVEVRKPKHNVETECPNCSSKVTLKTETRATKIVDQTVATLLQYSHSTKEFIVRSFEVAKRYGREYRTPRLTIYEHHRTLNLWKAEERNYAYGMFKQRIGDMRWNRVMENHNPISVLYPYNLHELMHLPELNYSGVQEMATSSPDMRFHVSYLIKKNLNGDHIAEKLAKVGLFHLAKDYISCQGNRSFDYYHDHELDNEGTKLNDILQVGNDDAKLLIEANVSMKGLGLFRFFRSGGKRLTAEELNIMEKLKIQKYHLTADGICRHVPITKALKYLDKIYRETRKIQTTAYRDYLNMCHELEMDMKSKKVLFPKNLRESHDIVVGILNERQAEREAKALENDYAAIKERSLEYDKYYGYRDKNFLIRAAQDGLEIVNEGFALCHCVGSRFYLRNVAQGKTVILFLRKCDEPDKSFYTIQMREGRLIQCRTHGNVGVEGKELKKFLQDWQKELERRVAVSA